MHDVENATFAYILLPDLSVSIVFLGIEFSVQANGFYDFSSQWWIFPWAPTGYLNPLQGSWGGFISSTLSIPLLRRRRGYWGCGLYFGDWFLIPFLDLSFNQGANLQLSYGGTLQLETKSARNDYPPSDLHITVGMNLEREWLILFGIGNIELLLDYYGSMLPCRPLTSASK
jgi:hypothetical protein